MSDMTSPRFCERFCIGLTGGIASGKSTVSERLSELGAGVVDTDVIAHALTQVGGAAMPAIQAAFGDGFINADGSMNRSAMRTKVFAQPDERKRLEAILHPMIHARTRELGATVVGDYVVFVVPLLIESPRWRHQVDRIVVVDSEPLVQQERLLKRDGISLGQAQQIMAAQASREQRLAAADVTVQNNSDRAALLYAIDQLHASFCVLTRTHEQALSAKLDR
jgi:dephospho-CoA kinase